MKFLKWILSILGLVGLVAAGIMLAKNIIDINQLVAVASANRSTGWTNPRRWIYWTVGLAALGGLLLGWGIGLPRRTGRSVRNAYRTDLQNQGLIVDRDGDGHPDRV